MAEWMVTVGDCRDVLAGLEPQSVDAVVCDPPYELSFMGKGWDGTGIAYDPAMWAEVLRVLRPGGHLLAFGGTRTFHRMTVAIEDAGFEVRDCLSWLYGSGFPKSLNVGKAIDKRRDDRNDVLRVTGEIARLRDAAGLTNRDLDGLFGFAGMAGHWTSTKSQPTVPTPEQWTVLRERLEPPQWLDDEVWRLNGRKGTPGEAWGEREVVGTRSGSEMVYAPGEGRKAERKDVMLTAPATDEARRWEGWGTALKPAWEPIVMARKPLVGTVAGNVLAHGTGGLNIDGSRIGTDEKTGRPPGRVPTEGWGLAKRTEPSESHAQGRWPANVLLDEGAAAALDEQTGPLPHGWSPNRNGGFKAGWKASGGADQLKASSRPNANGGRHEAGTGASRFFHVFPNDEDAATRFRYVAKASRRDRNEGLDGMPEKEWTGNYGDGIQDNRPHTRDGYTYSSVTKNHHPTVKPTALMRHLVRLVTPPGGLVLDPFTGSGSTGKAAVLEGFRFHGIEQDAEYAEIARARIAWAADQADEEPDQPTLM